MAKKKPRVARLCCMLSLRHDDRKRMTYLPNGTEAEPPPPKPHDSRGLNFFGTIVPDMGRTHVFPVHDGTNFFLEPGIAPVGKDEEFLTDTKAGGQVVLAARDQAHIPDPVVLQQVDRMLVRGMTPGQLVVILVVQPGFVV